jgi:hypothetical protein
MAACSWRLAAKPTPGHVSAQSYRIKKHCIAHLVGELRIPAHFLKQRWVISIHLILIKGPTLVRSFVIYIFQSVYASLACVFWQRKACLVNGMDA